MNDVGQPSASFGPLVETDWLASELGAPDLRVIDCMVFLHPLPDGSGQRAESGRAALGSGAHSAVISAFYRLGLDQRGISRVLCRR